MGEIRKLLAGNVMERRSITATGIWVDLCENIHLHYRNLRLEFSEKEWAQFIHAVHMLGQAELHTAHQHNYREGDPNFLVQCHYNQPLSGDSTYFPNRLTVEEQFDGTYHVHYRDLRLHLSRREFMTVACAFEQALRRINNPDGDVWPEERFAAITERQRVRVPIQWVQPYDKGHKPLAIDADHRAGIEFVKQCIRDGKRLRPVLVDVRGVRRDGFKRYMAQLEMGYREIEVIVDPHIAELGGQWHESIFDDEANEDAASGCADQI